MEKHGNLYSTRMKVVGNSNKKNMEVVFYAAFTSLWWILSGSFFLPLVLLLKFSKPIRNAWFAWLYSTFLKLSVEKQQAPCRELCFNTLKTKLEDRNTAIPLRIVEIGIGTGPNLKYYPQNTTLIAVDMNVSFEKYFNISKVKHPNVHLEKLVVAMAEDMNEIEDNSVDVVLSTYVLCSVENVRKVLSETLRILKPGGHFAYLEHVAFPKTEWSYTIQRMAAPIWFLYCNGCCPHRTISDDIKKAGFSKVECQYMEFPSLNLFVRPNILGIATK